MKRVHAPARVRRRDRAGGLVDGDGVAELRDGGAAHARAVRGRRRHAVARVPTVAICYAGARGTRPRDCFMKSDWMAGRVAVYLAVDMVLGLAVPARARGVSKEQGSN